MEYMKYVLHLTEKCNLRCKYCYQNRNTRELDFEKIKTLIDREVKNKTKRLELVFYGGEPLLKENIIKQTIEYSKLKNGRTKFLYGITTNGTLLDDEFIRFMKENNFTNIGYSIDGNKIVQNMNRVTSEGEGTFDIVEKNAKKVIINFDDVVAMMTVCKNTLKYLSKSIEYLSELGFKYINPTLNYSENWNEEDLRELKKQYKLIGEFYKNKMMREEDINISFLEDKIYNYIKDKDCNEQCEIGTKNVNVDVNGNLYPCMQFVGKSEYIIGNCEKGIDKKSLKNIIIHNSFENELCRECSINKRCKHRCPCRNFLATGDINKLSPIVCETEKIAIEISDEVAEYLYKNNSELFIQKYYNKGYNLIKNIMGRKK